MKFCSENWAKYTDNLRLKYLDIRLRTVKKFTSRDHVRELKIMQIYILVYLTVASGKWVIVMDLLWERHIMES